MKSVRDMGVVEKNAKPGRQQTSFGAIAVTPMPSLEELAAFYAKTYYQDTPSVTYQGQYSENELDQKRMRAKLLLYAVERVQSHFSGQSRFLEVGCGEGFVLQAAVQNGYEVCGVDFSDFGLSKFHPELRNFLQTGDACQVLGVMIANGACYDVCVLQNVLEHVREPKALLEQVYKVMDLDSVAIVTVPNDFSRLQKKALEIGIVDHEYWFLPPQHLHYFDVDTARQFVTECGFEVLDAFGDFPIEFFLYHPGSNYVANRENGRAAHEARLQLDLLLAERGIPSYYAFCQALSGCGVGRNVSLVIRKNGNG